VIVCLCMGLSDGDISRAVDGGCGSFDELVKSNLTDSKRACRECEKVVEACIDSRRRKTVHQFEKNSVNGKNRSQK